MSALQSWLPMIIKACYFIAAFLFIYGLKRMGSPRTARRGIVQAGIGMVVATVATFFMPDMHNYLLMLVAIAIGGGLAWWTGQRVAMTDMPQMVALYNGMGGGSAAAIGAVELYKAGAGSLVVAPVPASLAVAGGIIGAVAFSGSMIAFAKLQGWLDRRFLWPGQNPLNGLLLLAVLGLGGWLVVAPDQGVLIAFFALALLLGVLMTLPIGGADMPVVISLYNALTGLAVAFEGFVLDNEAMIIAGTVVGAAGTLLTQLMAKAMNRPLSNVLFAGIAASGSGGDIDGEQKPIDAADAASLMAWAERVVVVPGYGMAVAQAQHKLWEFCQGLMARGVKVKFAIHPVAGRMPGHMNVLLAEAGVPYDLIVDMDDINPEFKNTDVALVIGANDVVNPVARTDPASPIYGMPILDVDQARNVIIIKRGKGRGFAGIENALFYGENARLLYGDGNAVAGDLAAELKQLDG
ncbi:MAG: NAD(P)(+) transhydrogenase (Re/Si-specific) subunit beta [Xanthomonadales bacterium]|nr:NAD(P)(+) transhydrogenase (Re/Si-specific) subunit beta [Xanthomonadales bacterium]